MLKSNKNFIWFFLAIILVIGLLSFNTLKSWLTGKNTSSNTRDLALSCTTDAVTQFHIHPHLTILVDGVGEKIPANIGDSLTCLHPLHTHDDTGKIHVESPEQRDFTLGDFFAVWEKPLDRAGKTLTAKVNGTEVVDSSTIILRDLEEIVLEYKSK